MKESTVIIAVLLVALFSTVRMVFKLDKSLTKSRADVVKWEQLYRDCQAARQFSEPAHAADAVSDVTRP